MKFARKEKVDIKQYLQQMKAKRTSRQFPPSENGRLLENDMYSNTGSYCHSIPVSIPRHYERGEVGQQLYRPNQYEHPGYHPIQPYSYSNRYEQFSQLSQLSQNTAKHTKQFPIVYPATSQLSNGSQWLCNYPLPQPPAKVQPLIVGSNYQGMQRNGGPQLVSNYSGRTSERFEGVQQNKEIELVVEQDLNPNRLQKYNPLEQPLLCDRSMKKNPFIEQDEMDLLQKINKNFSFTTESNRDIESKSLELVQTIPSQVIPVTEKKQSNVSTDVFDEIETTIAPETKQIKKHRRGPNRKTNESNQQQSVPCPLSQAQIIQRCSFYLSSIDKQIEKMISQAIPADFIINAKSKMDEILQKASQILSSNKRTSTITSLEKKVNQAIQK